MLVPTLRSVFAARDHARRHGHDVEFVFVGDRMDDVTRGVLARYADQIDVFEEADVGDPGAARRIGVQLSNHDHVFFHDADDLYCESWYTRFLNVAASGLHPSRAIFHGQVMVGFGVETYFRLQTASTDLGFEPMALACQWYFATNLMTPRSVALEHPVPLHNAKSGIGHDDWTWSCDTLAAGVPRLVVPGTVSFYREKPANEGVGKVPGIIHHASRLFDPDFVRANSEQMLSRHHAVGPYAFGSSFDARDRTQEGFVPGWVIDDVRAQSAFEPMLTDLYDTERTPRTFKTLPRQANVGLAWRDLCEDLDARPKIVISATEKHMVAADMTIAEIVAGVVAAAGPDVQVICLVDGDKFHWDRRLYLRKYGAVMIDVTEFRRQYRLEDWYFFRFIMRLYVQFELRMALDLGSDFFFRLFNEFNRPICALAKDIRFAYTGLADDPINGARINIVRGADLYASATNRPAQVLSFAPDFAAFMASDACVARVLPPAAREALRAAGLRRFATDPRARSVPLDNAGVGAFLLASHAAGAAAHSGPGDTQAALALEGQSRLRDRIYAITAGHGTFAPEVLERARVAFAADPTLEVLIPQVVFWPEQGGVGHRFTWLEPHHIADRIAGCVDLMMMHKINLPFFALFRGAGASQRHYKRLRWRDYDTGSLDLLRELYELAAVAKLRPLDGSVCAGNGIVPFEFEALAEHV
jgi:Glycosyl transferase family 2